MFNRIKMNCLAASAVCGYAVMLWLAFPATASANVMVLDFELKDLTIYQDNSEEIERTARFKPLLEQALSDLAQLQIVNYDIREQAKADIGRGYLYDHHDIVADFGRAHQARWVVVGRVHKPSYLFSYLKVLLIDVAAGSMAADLTVELKGQQDKFIKKKRRPPGDTGHGGHRPLQPVAEPLVIIHDSMS